MPWHSLLHLPFPAFLGGFLLRDWWKLLQKHHFAIDLPFLPRAVFATIGGAVTSVLHPIEKRIVARHPHGGHWKEPVFILGLPRSGTTHLFQLLARDPYFCFPSRFDAFHPHTFLTLRKACAFALLSRLPDFKRGLDSIRTGWGSPEEDIMALTVLTGVGEIERSLFPRDFYAHGNLHLAEQTEEATASKMIEALGDFCHKLVLLHGRPVLLKSPEHTGRVRAILDVFPQAKFVTIFREPLKQVASLKAAREFGGMPFWCSLQWPPDCWVEEVLRNQGRMLTRYFGDRELIPEGNLLEIRYEELVANRVASMENIYRMLGRELPVAVRTLATACDRKQESLRTHDSLPDAWIEHIRKNYRPLFERGFYATP